MGNSNDKIQTNSGGTSTGGQKSDANPVVEKNAVVAAHQEKQPPIKLTRKGSKLDRSRNYQMWNNIVTNSMVGTGVFSKASICNVENGAIFATCPPEFQPSVDEAKQLARGVQDPTCLATKGFHIHDYFFQYKSGCIGSRVEGTTEDGETNAIVGTTKAVVVMALYERDPTRAKEIFAELIDYIIDNGL